MLPDKTSSHSVTNAQSNVMLKHLLPHPIPEVKHLHHGITKSEQSRYRQQMLKYTVKVAVAHNTQRLILTNQYHATFSWIVQQCLETNIKRNDCPVLPTRGDLVATKYAMKVWD